MLGATCGDRPSPRRAYPGLVRSGILSRRGKLGATRNIVPGGSAGLPAPLTALPGHPGPRLRLRSVVLLHLGRARVGREHDAHLAVAAPAAPQAPLWLANRRLARSRDAQRRPNADRRAMAAALPALAAGREPKRIR